jgi:hypothetical protein
MHDETKDPVFTAIQERIADDVPEGSSLIVEPVMLASDPYVVVRFWDHGVLYTCSLCGNYPDFPTREAAESHVKSHKA